MITYKLGSKIYFDGENISLFNESQCKPKIGNYEYSLVKLIDIDVVIKKINNREFFYWDNNIDTYINNIINNFEYLPPIILEKFNDKYYSIDGHHRIVAATELRHKYIKGYFINVDKLSYIRRS